ncbi:MAG: DegV family protein [Oscillospiraceae bacterium]|nr:DegV family protein [Oscillospiraceae bacterium]
MAFIVMTDAECNLTGEYLEKHNVPIVPMPYFIGDMEFHCNRLEDFNDKQFWDTVRNGVTVSTSQINPQRYADAFEPHLKNGNDVLFISMSSGISGSYGSSRIAADMMKEAYPDRCVAAIDSRGAALGVGLLVMRAVKCRDNGMSLEETEQRITSLRDRMYQVFTVDDLMHLKRTGRLSNIGAVVGTVLGVKPLLKGDRDGKIVAFGLIRGRRKIAKTLADKYVSLVKNPEAQTIGILHTDCEQDAQELADLIREKLPPKEILLLKYEPVTGSHLGPGAIALFFEGGDGVREQ